MEVCIASGWAARSSSCNEQRLAAVLQCGCIPFAAAVAAPSLTVSVHALDLGAHWALLPHVVPQQQQQLLRRYLLQLCDVVVAGAPQQLPVLLQLRVLLLGLELPQLQ
jgi:hypothetical protein